MSIIYIQRLFHNKTAVCRALFNAAAMTEKGKAEKKLAIQLTADVPGVWSPLQDYEIEQALWSSRHSGVLLDIGYLQVKLQFEIDSLNVAYYEETYGISAKKTLEAAGFICSDKPINNNDTSFSVTEKRPCGNFYESSVSKDKSECSTDSKIIQKNIELDKRFKKSTKEGVLYESRSYSKISDDELRAYGAKTWTRDKDGMDNIVLVSEMTNTKEVSKQPSKSLVVK